MIIFPDCYEKISCADCQYGGHIFDGENFSVYISNWLDVSDEIRLNFRKKNEQGYVGHCNLLFKNVASCRVRIKYYSYTEDNRVLWTPAQNIYYQGREDGSKKNEFILGGSLKGFRSSIEFFISAETCDLVILEPDEPAQE